MVDFNGFDKGVIGKKLPSDTTLNNMRKADLIELLHIAEHNHRVLAETYKIAVDTSKCKSCPLSINGEESYQKGRADEQDRMLSIVRRCIAYNVYKASEGIALLDAIKEELKEKKE